MDGEILRRGDWDVTGIKTCPHCQGGMEQRIRQGKKGGWSCRACNTRNATIYRTTRPDKWLDTKLWTFYGIRLSDYHRMFNEQKGCCAACGVPAELLLIGSGKKGTGFNGDGLVIDHDHLCCPSTRTSGRGPACGECVRGLLCGGCNVAAGMVKDDPERLEKIAAYLRRWQNRPRNLDSILRGENHD